MQRRPRKSEFSGRGDHADTENRRIPTEGDKGFLRRFDDYVELPGPWLAALEGRTYYRNSDNRLATLSREPHSLLVRRKKWFNDSTYRRSEKGDKLLDSYPRGTKDPLKHRILEDLVQASIELGAMADKEVTLIKWRELAHEAPDVIQDIIDARGNPHRIPVRSSHYVGDGAPFRLHRKDQYVNILTKEIHRETEGTSSRETIESKLKALHEIYASKIYRTHYGFKNAIVLFVAITENGQRTILKKIAKQFPKGCPFVLVTYWKDWEEEAHYPPPTDTMFMRGWKRHGHPDFFLNKFWES